jgi:hypothetical protein
LPDVRDRYDAYREAASREVYRFRSGLKPTLELDEVDDRFGDVTSGDLLEEVESRAETGFMEEAREDARRLALGVRRAMVDRSVRPLSREVDEREAAQRMRIDGKERSLFEWQAHLGSEKEVERRRRIQESLESVWDELNPQRQDLWMRRAELLARQGFETPRAWANALHPDIDYGVWREHADSLLERTEAPYRDGMSKGLASLGVDAGSAHPGDAARLFRMEAFDAVFPAARIYESLQFTLEGMSIRIEGLPGVTFDREARPGKHPRASCVAPRIPGEVYVLAYPRGGVPDYESLFHEAGHALHFAFTSPALPVERRRIFDPALSETWAFLLNYRLTDPDWLAQSPAAERAAMLLPSLRLHKLFLLRRYAAKLRFELELVSLPSGESTAPLAELYAEELSRATGLRYRPVSYLVDTDADLYCADYLRAWCLEARLSEWLRERFDRRFWRERRAGELLKELWNTGGTYTADGLAEQLGIGPIGPEALIEECLRASEA